MNAEVCSWRCVKLCCHVLQGLHGLETFHFHKVGKRGELTLVWAAEEPGKPSVRQVRPRDRAK